MAFLHAAAFSPTLSTFIEAVKKGVFTTWSGLTSKRLKQHMDTTPETAKGNLDQVMANIQSTKTNTAFSTIADTTQMCSQREKYTTSESHNMCLLSYNIYPVWHIIFIGLAQNNACI